MQLAEIVEALNATNTEAEGEEVGCPLLRGDEPCGRHADPVRGLNPEVEPGVAQSHPGNSGRACVVAGDAADQECVGQSDVLVASVRTANRRDRAAYNAYQREYMRRKRLNG
jgi:hypothetical protein